MSTGMDEAIEAAALQLAEVHAHGLWDKLRDGDKVIVLGNPRSQVKLVAPIIAAAVRADVRQSIADEIRQKITDWEPHCSGAYIRGMRAALLYVTGDAHQPLFATDADR